MGSFRDNKRYFWLKLKEDFFDQDAINWLEEQHNGKAYTLFYLKLCLKAMNNNGALIRKVGDMLIPYDAEKLGKITNTDKDTVIVALELLKKIKLVEIQDDGTLYLTQLENMIGSETGGAARKRTKRKEQKELLLKQGQTESADNVRNLSADCPQDVRKMSARDRDRYRYRDRYNNNNNNACARVRDENHTLQADEPPVIDNDCQLAELIQFYEANISTISPFLFEQIQILEQEYTSEWVLEAMKMAVAGGRSKSNIRYIEGILKGWKAHGYAKPWEKDPAQLKEQKSKQEIAEAEALKRKNTVGTQEWKEEQEKQAARLKQVVQQMKDEEARQEAKHAETEQECQLPHEVQALKERVLQHIIMRKSGGN